MWELQCLAQSVDYFEVNLWLALYGVCIEAKQVIITKENKMLGKNIDRVGLLELTSSSSVTGHSVMFWMRPFTHCVCPCLYLCHFIFFGVENVTENWCFQQLKGIFCCLTALFFYFYFLSQAQFPTWNALLSPRFWHCFNLYKNSFSHQDLQVVRKLLAPKFRFFFFLINKPFPFSPLVLWWRLTFAALLKALCQCNCATAAVAAALVAAVALQVQYGPQTEGRISQRVSGLSHDSMCGPWFSSVLKCVWCGLGLVSDFFFIYFFYYLTSFIFELARWCYCYLFRWSACLFIWASFLRLLCSVAST